MRRDALATCGTVATGVSMNSIAARNQKADQSSHTERDADRVIRMVANHFISRLGAFNGALLDLVPSVLAFFDRGGEAFACLDDLVFSDLSGRAQQSFRVLSQGLNVVLAGGGMSFHGQCLLVSSDYCLLMLSVRYV